MKPCFVIATLFIAVSVTSLVSADDLTPNLIHDRHKHKHNAPHATEQPTNARFYTTRSSQVTLPLPNEKDAFVFAVFGDRTGGPADGVNILADAVRDVNLIEPDLVMTVGDLINGYNQTPEWMEQMREFKAIMGELLCPWFPVAGNHDTYWRPLSDTQMPFGQHDEHYEIHFGPLWYSYQHKNCNFIVLYSDEGNPETGEKNFGKPENQKISNAQLKFLKESLARGKDNDHQFVFLHHPRWLGGGYGDDWKIKVHPLLVEAGNVSAVFAGHIHYMRYDPQDGIEYVTLATVGGGQSGRVPNAGYLHQYHLVTVRPKQIALTAYPVGEAMNVREITRELQDQAVQLAGHHPSIKGKIVINEQGVLPSTVEVTVDNPADRPIDFTLSPGSADPNWNYAPDHIHGRLNPGESTQVELKISYGKESLDDNFQGLNLLLAQDYLARTTRYTIPVNETSISIDMKVPVKQSNLPNRALKLDGHNDTLRIPADSFNLHQGPFTLEAWFKAESYSSRVGFLAKSESSDYCLFLSNGSPDASLHLNGSYRTVKSAEKIPTNQWTHLAMVYDGEGVTMYANGKKLGHTKTDPTWKRTTNSHPIFIGADPNSQGQPMSFFHGLIDEVRLSSAVVYTDEFIPERRLDATDQTVFLYNFDQSLGPIHFDAGPHQNHRQAEGGARLVDANP